MDQIMKEEGSHMCGPGGCADKGGCKCMHHKSYPILVVLFGLLFLLKALGVVSMSMVDVVWPILVMLLGIMKICGAKCKCC